MSNHRQDVRHARILKKYGLTEEQWLALWDECHGHCPACAKPFSSSRLACVDHDHRTGLIRGLLCTACNYAVGERHDKADWFRRVWEYLNVPPALEVIGRVYMPGSSGDLRAFADLPALGYPPNDGRTPEG